MAPKEYQLIPEESALDDPSSSQVPAHRSSPYPHPLLLKIVIALFASSLSINGLWTIKYLQSLSSDEGCSTKTSYGPILIRIDLHRETANDKPAGLTRNLPIPWTHDSDFASHNRSIVDNAWKLLDEDAGVVALIDAFVTEKGLPLAQRFPWDNSKGLYLLHGYHNLHCLNILRTALMEIHGKHRRASTSATAATAWMRFGKTSSATPTTLPTTPDFPCPRPRDWGR